MKESVQTISPSNISRTSLCQREVSDCDICFSDHSHVYGAERRREWIQENKQIHQKEITMTVLESPKIDLNLSKTYAKVIQVTDKDKSDEKKVEISISQIFQEQKSRTESVSAICQNELTINDLQKMRNKRHSIFISNGESDMIKSGLSPKQLIVKKKAKSSTFNLFNFKVMKGIITHMKQHILPRKYQDLSQNNISQINDYSIIQNQKDQFIYSNFSFRFLSLLLPPVFSPDSPYFIAWNILVFLTIIVQVFLIPLEVSFNVGFGKGDLFLGLIYVVEVLINFNSAYYEEGIIIFDRKKIVLQYTKKQFWLDLCTCLVFLFNSDHRILFLDLIFIFRISNILSIYKEIVQFFQFYRYQALTDMCSLLFWTAFMAHYMGCGFHFISESDSLSWIKEMGIQNSDWKVQYVFSVYFSFVTMSTIGYGDIVPVSVSERIYVIIMLIIGCGWFAYVINKASQILSDMQVKKKEIRDKQYKILDYMRNRNISKALQLKVVKYLEFIDQKESNNTNHGIKILETMSKDLREQVLRECYKPILQKHFAFKSVFSDALLENLIVHVREISLGPGEVISNEKEGEKMLFFIKEGIVNLVSAKEENRTSFTISTLEVRIFLLFFPKQLEYFMKKNQFLGTNQFFQIIPSSSYSAVCQNECHLVYFSLSSFLEVAKHFPADLEKYFMIKEKGKWHKSITDCEICAKGKHFFLRCPAVFYSPNYLQIISKLNRNSPHKERSSYKRNFSKGTCTLANKKEIQRKTRQFRKQLEKIVLEQDVKKISPGMKSIGVLEIIEELPQSSIEVLKVSSQGCPSQQKEGEITQRSKNSPCEANLCHQNSLIKGTDREFFKGCVQFEFVNNQLQQCSEYETDSAESQNYTESDGDDEEENESIKKVQFLKKEVSEVSQQHHRNDPHSQLGMKKNEESFEHIYQTNILKLDNRSNNFFPNPTLQLFQTSKQEQGSFVQQQESNLSIQQINSQIFNTPTLQVNGPMSPPQSPSHSQAANSQISLSIIPSSQHHDQISHSLSYLNDEQYFSPLF